MLSIQMPRSAIEENLKFMVIEVHKQLDELSVILKAPSEKLFEKVVFRDSYINTLKNTIEAKCFTLNLAEDKKQADFIKAVDIISNNLEHIGDYVVSVVKQFRFLDNPLFLSTYPSQDFLNETTRSLKIINQALAHQHIDHALEICRAEAKIDQLYKDVFNRILEELKKGRDVQNYVTALNIFSQLERIGDALLNIGEAFLLIFLGEKVKFNQFNSFQKVILSGNIPHSSDQLSFHSMGETRSGCLIDRISMIDPTTHQEGMLVFKDGNLKKIVKEKENIERWQDLIPGIAPKIYGFYQQEQNASILIEHLKGRTLKELLIEDDEQILKEALSVLKVKLHEIWTKSRQDTPVRAWHVHQIKSRLNDVFKVYPDFKLNGYHLGALNVLSLEELLVIVESIEQELMPPFSVFIHGDFNVDNILYATSLKQIFFVDLYRSTQMDYVQDIAVFLVSNFRLPLFTQESRLRLNKSIKDFFCFAVDFAKAQSDTAFQARLAVGVARSLITSTRFEPQKKFAKIMLGRAIYLMEKLAAHQSKPWPTFKLPLETITY